MGFPNVSDIVATTIESRTREIADNVTKNNVIYARLKRKGKINSFDGGSVIFQEFSYAENGNFSWYSGYDLLPVAAQDVISAAQFAIKQCACAVTMSGLEMLENAGREKQISLIDSRVGVAEATMANNMAVALYSDGTGFGGKQITGLAAAVAAAPSSGTYGAIDRAAWPFWRNQSTTGIGAFTALNIQAAMNALWVKLVRGKDKPDLIVADNVAYSAFESSLQQLQRITDTKEAELGFASLKYKNADVVLDGGIGGACPASVMYFLNTDYIFLRPHSARNMVPLNPETRSAINQDAIVKLIGWAGNLTCSGAQFQGYMSAA